MAVPYVTEKQAIKIAKQFGGSGSGSGGLSIETLGITTVGFDGNDNIKFDFSLDNTHVETEEEFFAYWQQYKLLILTYGYSSAFFLVPQINSQTFNEGLLSLMNMPYNSGGSTAVGRLRLISAYGFSDKKVSARIQSNVIYQFDNAPYAVLIGIK